MMHYIQKIIEHMGMKGKVSMAAFGCLHIVTLNIKGGMRAATKQEPGNDIDHFVCEIFIMPKYI